jgi:hypothetical protein
MRNELQCLEVGLIVVSEQRALDPDIGQAP